MANAAVWADESAAEIWGGANYGFSLEDFGITVTLGKLDGSDGWQDLRDEIGRLFRPDTVTVAYESVDGPVDVTVSGNVLLRSGEPGARRTGMAWYAKPGDMPESGEDAMPAWVRAAVLHADAQARRVVA